MGFGSICCRPGSVRFITVGRIFGGVQGRYQLCPETCSDEVAWQVCAPSVQHFFTVQSNISSHSNSNSTTISYFDAESLNLSIAMTGQSVVKHFLTEGDKFLVSRLSPSEDQGGYAIASNYGALNPSLTTPRSSSSSQRCVLSIFCLDLLMHESGLLLTWIVRLVGGAYSSNLSRRLRGFTSPSYHLHFRGQRNGKMKMAKLNDASLKEAVKHV